jgi:cytochrome c-type biogenesis protein CcsB
VQPEQALLIIGAAAYGAFILSIITSHKNYAKYCAFAGCVLILLALALRWYTVGRPPWAALYETAALLALMAGLAAAVTHRKGEPAPFSIALAALSILLALFSAYLWEPASALPEALASGWLLVHVPVVIIAYGLFATSAMASVSYLYLHLGGGRSKDTLDRLDRIANLSACVGLALLVVGTFLGALWAKAAWGTYWSWDPKETWALVTIIIYAAYAGLRWKGMRGEDAAYLSLLGFMSVIFTYIGVSYLIPGLHSYA